MPYLITTTPPTPSNFNYFFNRYQSYQFASSRPTVSFSGTSEPLFLLNLGDGLVRVYYNRIMTLTFPNNSSPARSVGIYLDFDVTSGSWVYKDFGLPDASSWLSNPNLQFFDYPGPYLLDGVDCYYLRNNTPWNSVCSAYSGISLNNESEVYFGIISIITIIFIFYSAYKIILRPFWRRLGR